MSEVPPAAPAPEPVPVVAVSKPGRGLGIAGLILAIIPFTQLIGLVLSIIGLVISRRAGFKNGPAVAGIIVAIIVGIIIIVISIVASLAGVAALQSLCEGYDPGTYTLDNGGTITCS